MCKNFIGIDVSKDSFSFCVINEEKQILKEGLYSIDNDGFAKFKNSVEGIENPAIVMESTSSYHIALLIWLCSCFKSVFLVNPYLIKNFTRSASARKTKTDKIDSQHIAHFALHYHQDLRPWNAAANNDFSELARYRDAIVQQNASRKTLLKQRLMTAFPELEKKYNVFTDSFLFFLQNIPSADAARKSNPKKLEKIIQKGTPAKGRRASVYVSEIQELAEKSIGTSNQSLDIIIASLAQEILHTSKTIESLTEQLLCFVKKSYQNQLDILTSIPGVGEVSAAQFIAEIKDINRFDNVADITAFIGTDPAISQSGSINRKGRISKRGCPNLRRLGYIMATCVIRTCPTFHAYYRKKRTEGMPAKKAIIATWNKLLRTIFSMLKNNSHFSILNS